MKGVSVMISAIIYSSTTGSCKQYAEKLSAALHIPAFDAKKVYTPKGREVIYVGWLFAGKVVGLEKALQGYDVRAVVQVGMADNAGAEDACREKNGLAADVQVFSLQGRFNLAGLPLPLKLIMKIKTKDIAKRLNAKAAKASLTPAEQACLKMAETGKGEPATWDGVQAVIDWAVARTNPPAVKKWPEV